MSTIYFDYIHSTSSLQFLADPCPTSLICAGHVPMSVEPYTEAWSICWQPDPFHPFWNADCHHFSILKSSKTDIHTCLGTFFNGFYVWRVRHSF